MIVFDKKSLALLVAWLTLGLLSACGGGGDSSGTTPAPEPTVLKLPDFTAKLLPDNKLQVVMIPAEASSVAGYCVRTDSVTPAASDSCFKTTATQEVASSGSATAATELRSWTKNSAGSVSFHKTMSVPGKTCSSAAYAASTASALATACLITDKGELVVELEAVKAPITVKNFLRYVNESFYNGTYFHRVTSSFVAQGGGFTLNGSSYVKKAATYPAITLESTTLTGFSNLKNTIAMARGSSADSATTEFFINVVDNVQLDKSALSGDGYAVFGRLIYGHTPAQTPLQALEAIAKSPVITSSILTSQPEVSQPSTPIALQWAYQIK